MTINDGEAGSQGFKRYPTWNPEKGIVYCAVSTAKSGQVKIGACTMSLSERLYRLKNRHGLPNAVAVFSMQVSHPAKVEFYAQEAVKASRVVGRTKGDSIEWYQISASKAAAALVQAAIDCGEIVGTVDYYGRRHSDAKELLKSGMFSNTITTIPSKPANARSDYVRKAPAPKRVKDYPPGDGIRPSGFKIVLPPTHVIEPAGYLHLFNSIPSAISASAVTVNVPLHDVMGRIEPTFMSPAPSKSEPQQMAHGIQNDYLPLLISALVLGLCGLVGVAIWYN